MVTFEERIEEIMALEGFSSYSIKEWNNYRGTVEFLIDGVLGRKTFIDDGTGNFVEVSE